MARNGRPDIVIIDGARTPFGNFGGALKDVSAIDLAVVAAKGAMTRAHVDPSKIDTIVFGNVMQTSADGIYGARHVGLKAGCPIDTPALTVNRLCGSGLQAIVSGAQSLLLGEATYVLAGGMENMSQAPHVIRGARWGFALGQGKLEDTLWEGLTDSYNGMPMAITAENLAKLPPRFKKDGVVTPGNASGITDGAAAVVLTTAARAEKDGLKPLGRIVGWAAVGVDPDIMGIGPAFAIPEALTRSGMKLDDMDVVE